MNAIVLEPIYMRPTSLNFQHQLIGFDFKISCEMTSLSSQMYTNNSSNSPMNSCCFEFRHIAIIFIAQTVGMNKSKIRITFQVAPLHRYVHANFCRLRTILCLFRIWCSIRLSLRRVHEWDSRMSIINSFSFLIDFAGRHFRNVISWVSHISPGNIFDIVNRKNMNSMSTNYACSRNQYYSRPVLQVIKSYSSVLIQFSILLTQRYLTKWVI